MSWRDVLPVHPAAAVFPEASPEDLKALRLSIRETGLQNGVILWTDGAQTYLLDGRSRLDALERNGINVLASSGRGVIDRQYLGSDIDALSSCTAAQVVIGANIRRRHLTPKQRAELAVAAIKAEREMKKGITGKGFPVIGEKDKPPRQKGKRGSVKGDVSEVADVAGVSKPTARAAIRKAQGEKPKKPKRPARPLASFSDYIAKLKAVSGEELGLLIAIRDRIDLLIKQAGQ